MHIVFILVKQTQCKLKLASLVTILLATCTPNRKIWITKLHQPMQKLIKPVTWKSLNIISSQLLSFAFHFGRLFYLGVITMVQVVLWQQNNTVTSHCYRRLTECLLITNGLKFETQFSLNIFILWFWGFVCVYWILN